MPPARRSWRAGRGGRAADRELDRHRADRLDRLAGHVGGEGLEGERAEAGGVGGDGGKRRIEHRDEVEGVEADDRDVPRDPPAEVARGEVRAAGDVVVVAEDRGRRIGGGEQLERGGARGGEPDLAAGVGHRVGVDARRCERRAPALVADAERRASDRRGDPADAAVAEAGQGGPDGGAPRRARPGGWSMPASPPAAPSRTTDGWPGISASITTSFSSRPPRRRGAWTMPNTRKPSTEPACSAS